MRGIFSSPGAGNSSSALVTLWLLFSIPMAGAVHLSVRREEGCTWFIRWKSFALSTLILIQFLLFLIFHLSDLFILRKMRKQDLPLSGLGIFPISPCRLLQRGRRRNLHLQLSPDDGDFHYNGPPGRRFNPLPAGPGLNGIYSSQAITAGQSYHVTDLPSESEKGRSKDSA